MHGFRIGRRGRLLIGILFALVLVSAFYHRRIQRAWSVALLLRSTNPRDEFFEELAREAGDPLDFLQRAWGTGKISHRLLVAAFLKNNALERSPWRSQAESLVLAGTRDADASVRELALAALEARHSPQLFEAALGQFGDLDPLVRLLGLDYVRKSDPKQGVPALIPLLDDPDLRVVTGAEVGLMRWSGEDYGVRVRLTVPSLQGPHPDQPEPANLEVIRRGVQQRKDWWRIHQNDYLSAPGSGTPFGPAEAVQLPQPPAPDFKLLDLEGKIVRLSDFRGKVVLLNFWATWCTACLVEIPDLVALQQKMEPQLVVLGVALDGVPDEHGDTPGDDADPPSVRKGPSLNAIRAKVERAARARRINYRVLLDPKNAVGGQYNGGELPTTVILDPEGRVRRRFIGERNLAVFEAMVAEAGKPFRAARTQGRGN